jgi:general secretion pathway protein D
MMTSANILNRHTLLACALLLAGTGQAQPAAQSAQQEAAPAIAPLSSEAKPAVQEPRIIRGDDRVYAPPKALPGLAGASSSYKFEDAPIVEVIHVFMREVLKVDYVLHQPLAGSVTLATRGPISPDDALALLESALQVNGLAMARDTRGVYHVGRPENLKSVAGNIRQAVGKDPLPPGYGAVIVPLQYIGANEMATILRPMAPADAIVRVDSVRNLLVLMGTRNQAEGWLDVVRTFDINLLKGMSVGLFPLKHASIKEVEAALSLMSGGGAAAAARPGGAAPAGAAAPAGTPAAAAGNRGAAASVASAAALGEGNPLFGALRIMPVERLNSILVVTPRAAYLEEARRWIDKLDQPSDGGAEPQLYIYRVQNGNARHLASVLNGVFGGTAAAGGQGGSGVAPGLNSVVGATSGQYSGTGAFGSQSSGFGSSFGGGLSGGGFGRSGMNSNTFPQQNRLNQVGAQPPATAQIGNIRVMADDLNNMLLVWSTKAEFDKMEATLKRLDLPPTQVLIEASIIEVTLNDDLSYGLQWAFNGGTGAGNQGFGQLGTGGIKPGTGSLADAGTKGFTYSLVNSAGQIRVALSALATKTNVKMISNPSLMVLDNHLAMMLVGNQVPVQSSTTDWPNNSAVTTSTIQYRDTGVNLAVTPSVNAGNLVTMQIDQTVTDTSDPKSTTPTFLQRQISSKVAVRSGESIVLGGLIKDTQNQGKSGIPLLQDLPLVGNLFGSNDRSGNRTELLVVITPKVVRTDPEIREVSEELRDRLRGLGELGAPRGNAPTPLAPVVQPPAAP